MEQNIKLHQSDETDDIMEELDKLLQMSPVQDDKDKDDDEEDEDKDEAEIEDIMAFGDRLLHRMTLGNAGMVDEHKEIPEQQELTLSENERLKEENERLKEKNKELELKLEESQKELVLKKEGFTELASSGLELCRKLKKTEECLLEQSGHYRSERSKNETLKHKLVGLGEHYEGHQNKIQDLQKQIEDLQKLNEEQKIIIEKQKINKEKQEIMMSERNSVIIFQRYGTGSGVDNNNCRPLSYWVQKLKPATKDNACTGIGD
jgi:hypothetical protein